MSIGPVEVVIVMVLFVVIVGAVVAMARRS
jgi:hypothetical protein